MRKTLLTLTLTALALALVSGVATAVPPGGPEARGHGSTTGVFEHFNFSAGGTPLDADGSIRVIDHETNTKVEGEVDCLNVIGNDAYLSGPITDTQPELFLRRFQAHAEDNGGPRGGKTARTRRIGSTFSSRAPASSSIAPRSVSSRASRSRGAT